MKTKIAAYLANSIPLLVFFVMILFIGKAAFPLHDFPIDIYHDLLNKIYDYRNTNFVFEHQMKMSGLVFALYLVNSLMLFNYKPDFSKEAEYLIELFYFFCGIIYGSVSIITVIVTYSFTTDFTNFTLANGFELYLKYETLANSYMMLTVIYFVVLFVVPLTVNIFNKK